MKNNLEINLTNSFIKLALYTEKFIAMFYYKKTKNLKF